MGDINTLGLEYKFTDNSNLLDKYLDLRKELYPVDTKFKGFRHFDYLEEEDYRDKAAKMLLVMNGDECVGGARLTICTPGSGVVLPLEYDITPDNSLKLFTLSDTLPELNLTNKVYGEFNRIVLKPDYRSGECTKEIFSKMLSESKKYNIDYMFGIGDILRARLYKKLYASFGMKVEIRKDIEIPNKDVYENLKMYLMVMDLHQLEKTTDRELLVQKEET